MLISLYLQIVKLYCMGIILLVFVANFVEKN